MVFPDTSPSYLCYLTSTVRPLFGTEHFSSSDTEGGLRPTLGTDLQEGSRIWTTVSRVPWYTPTVGTHVL